MSKKQLLPSELLGARIVNILDTEQRYGVGTLTASALVVEKDNQYYLIDGYLDQEVLITRIEKDDFRVTSNTTMELGD
jgi:hypothetical protein